MLNDGLSIINLIESQTLALSALARRKLTKSKLQFAPGVSLCRGHTQKVEIRRHSFYRTKCLLQSKPVTSNWLCFTAPALSFQRSHLTSAVTIRSSNVAWNFCVVRDRECAMHTKIPLFFEMTEYCGIYWLARTNIFLLVDTLTLYRRRLSRTWGAW